MQNKVMVSFVNVDGANFHEIFKKICGHRLETMAKNLDG